MLITVAIYQSLLNELTGVTCRMHAAVAIVRRRLLIEEGRRRHSRRVRVKHVQAGVNVVLVCDGEQ